MLEKKKQKNKRVSKKLLCEKKSQLSDQYINKVKNHIVF